MKDGARNRDDAPIVRRRLTPAEQQALDAVTDFVRHRAFAEARQSWRLAVEVLGACAAAAAIIVLIVMVFARHSSSLSAGAPNSANKPPVAGTPIPSQGANASCPDARLPSLPGPNEGPLMGVQVIGTQHVWMVGSGRILSSHDGGKTWRREYSGSARFYSVDALDDGHVWALADDSLLGTADGGNSWTALGEPPSPLMSVHFVSSSDGFGVTSGSCTLVHTDDGGHSWHPSSHAPAGVTSVCFTEPDDGWVGAGGRVWRTRDAGTTWQPVLDTGNKPGGTVFVQCAYPNGVAVLAQGPGAAGGSGASAAWTSPGADRFTQVWTAGWWTPQAVGAIAPGSYAGPLSIVNPQVTAWFGNTPGANDVSLVETAGGPQVTPSLSVPCRSTAIAAAFVTPAHGWVICSAAGTSGNPALLVTTNAGHSWSMQYAATP